MAAETAWPRPCPPALVLAPLGADGPAIAAEIGAAGFPARIVDTPAAFAATLSANGPEAALLAVVSQEGAVREVGEALEAAFRAEPSWARLPVLFLVANARRPPAVCRMLDRAENAPPFVVLERPVPPLVLRKMVEQLAEARRRQFETRDLVEELRRQEAYSAFLLDEVRHRTRNSLAVLQSLFSMSVRRAQDLDEFAASFRQRLRSLTTAHTRLADAGAAAQDLGTLLRDHVPPYAEAPGQLRIAGRPEVSLKSSIAFEVAIVVHELATNAAKHGALSTPEGEVELSWRVDPSDGALVVLWRERGGPAVPEPDRSGLGMTLIGRLPSAALDTALRFDREGVEWTARFRPADFEVSEA